MIFLAKINFFVKKYWQLLLLIIGAIVGILLFKRTDDTFTDKLKKIQAAHNKEIEQIEKIHEQEKKEHQENVKKLQNTLDSIQKQYDDAKKDLDENKKKEIEKIVKKYKNDPNALTKRLSDVTGFTVILPEENES